METYRLNIIRIIIASAFFLSVASCDTFFTTSPFGFLARDIGRMTDSQKIAFARRALSSGSREMMKQGYEALLTLENGIEGPDIMLLAAELAFGGSGVSEVLIALLAEGVPEGSTPPLEDLIGDLDYGILDAGLILFSSAADAGAEIEQSGYILAGVAHLFKAARTKNGFTGLGGDYDYEMAVLYFALADASSILDGLAPQ